KKSAARTQRLSDDVPLWAAAAIQRGPRTAAMLKSSTSQRPISRRSCDLVSILSAVCKPASAIFSPLKNNRAVQTALLVRAIHTPQKAYQIRCCFSDETYMSRLRPRPGGPAPPATEVENALPATGWRLWSAAPALHSGRRLVAAAR